MTVAEPGRWGAPHMEPWAAIPVWCFRRPGAGETVAFQLFTKLQSNSNPPKEILADIKVHIQLTDKEKIFFDPGVFLNTRAEFALSYLRC